MTGVATNGAAARADVLTVQDLLVHFPVKTGLFQRQSGAVRAVDGVSFAVAEREVFGIVGESGCGKTTLGRSILQLVDITGGSVSYRGTRLNGLSGAGLRRACRPLQMVFQDPIASLDPRMSIGRSIAEPIEVRGGAGAAVDDRVDELLGLVRLDSRARHRFPHQLSGGQCQRAGIARAVAADPELLICDEPVSALDVSVRGQILNLLVDIYEHLGMAMIFIAHDLNLVRHMSDRVAVMYLGVIVELADADALFAEPYHPYSRALVSASPLADPELERMRKRVILKPDIPSPANPPSGCRFRTRCPLARELCAEVVPPLRDAGNGRMVACHFVEESRTSIPIGLRSTTRASTSQEQTFT